MNRRSRLALALATALLLAGCGFRLKGTVVVPEGVDHVYVAARDELSAFSVELFRGLERADVQRAASPAEADAVVRVTVDRRGRRVLSVSARNTPQEFEIFYEVEYSIERAGEEVVPRQRLQLTRNISFDVSQLPSARRQKALPSTRGK